MTSALYRKNFAALQNRFPSLAAAVSGWPPLETGAARDRIAVVPAANGQPSLTINGRYIHSPRDPGREAARLAEHAATNAAADTATNTDGISGADGAPPAVVLLGFGLGWTARALAFALTETETPATAPRPLLIVEKRRDLFLAALENLDLCPLFERPNVIFVISDDSHAVLAGLEAVKKTGTILKTRALCEIDGEYYTEAGRVIETWASKDRINQATLARFGPLWERNRKKNAPFLQTLPGVRHLFGRLRFPVLLVAAGPSLDELRPVIDRLARRALVIACDTALRFLASAGVPPHIAVSADGQFWNYLHVAGLPEAFLHETALAAETAVHPSILAAPFGRRFLFETRNPAGQTAGDGADSVAASRGILRAGGSVATSAWDLALCVGATSIWAAGLDLAFPGGRTHYKGALFDSRIHSGASRFCPAETRSAEALRSGGPYKAASAAAASAGGGNPVLTDRRLGLYAAWFETAVRRAPEVPAFRLSAQGLFIKGILPRRPEDLLLLPEIKPEIDRVLKKLYVV